MKKQELDERLTALKTETKDALQMVYDGLNKGQRQKLLKDEKIKALLERYMVVIDE